jgi:hypothetical protein
MDKTRVKLRITPQGDEMKLILLGLVNLIALISLAEQPIVLGVLDRQNKSEFENTLLPVLKKHLATCSACQIKNFTPYNDKGEVRTEALANLNRTAELPAILFVNWNERLTSDNKGFHAAMSELSDKGVLLVVAAGQPRSNENSAPLAKTIFGQIKDAIIIGELGERDRLLGLSYFGPEMLTAIRPPRGLIGSGVSPGLFATQLASHFHMRKDWRQYFQDRKQKNRKIWLDMRDLFGR